MSSLQKLIINTLNCDVCPDTETSQIFGFPEMHTNVNLGILRHVCLASLARNELDSTKETRYAQQ